MCGDISSYKRPSKVSRASTAVCLKVPCTRLCSVIYNMIQLFKVSRISAGGNTPFIQCNLAFIGVLAGGVCYVPE